MQHLKFPHIDQFVQVVTANQRWAELSGKTPGTLSFHGTVKLHGTNAGIVCDGKNLNFQYRNTIASEQSDQYGFRRQLLPYTSELIDLCNHVNVIKQREGIVAIFGEWCGKGIMKGVAINGLEKRFVVFASYVLNSETCHWLNDLELRELGQSINALKNLLIDTIHNAPTWTIDVDFANPAASLAQLEQLTTEVENQCPYAQLTSTPGIGEGEGEGIVWHNYEHSYIFKTKGLKHKEKTGTVRVELDPELITDLRTFVEIYVVEARLEKGIEFVKETKGSIDIKFMGDFLGWLIGDIRREEAEAVEVLKDEHGELAGRNLNKAINKVAVSWFTNFIKQEAGL